MQVAATLVHRVIHPFGDALRTMNPRAYESLRWRIVRSGIAGGLMGQPMHHQLVLPFLVRPGDVVLDIGANIGQYSRPLANLVGLVGRVHAFEPVPATFAELTANLQREASAGSVVLNQMALGERPGTVTLTVPVDRPTEATAAPHITERWDDYASDSAKYANIECPMSTVDLYLRERQIERVSFMKCDVEGAELSVLKGAAEVLSSPRRPAIQLEVFDGWTASFGYSPSDLFAFLREIGGYEIYWFHEQGLRKVRPQDQVPGIFWEWVDFLCLVPGLHDERLNVARFLD